MVKRSRKRSWGPVHVVGVRPAPPGRGVARVDGLLGDCFDNGVAESFFGSLQLELLDEHRWDTRDQLANAIFDWIECWYNPKTATQLLRNAQPHRLRNRNRGLITTQTHPSAATGSSINLNCSRSARLRARDPALVFSALRASLFRSAFWDTSPQARITTSECHRGSDCCFASVRVQIGLGSLTNRLQMSSIRAYTLDARATIATASVVTMNPSPAISPTR